MGVNFCSSCGSVLVAATSDTTVTIQPVEELADLTDDDAAVTLLELPRGVGMLVVKRGPNTGSRYVLESELTRAGRHPESDIFLDDITVSRRHAEFTTGEGGKPGHPWFLSMPSSSGSQDSASFGCAIFAGDPG